jgi:HSP20 family protein
MALTRWDPFREMMSLRDAMDRLFEESFVRPSRWLVPRLEGAGTLHIDLYETDEAVVLKAPIAGVQPEDLDISIAGDTLTIKGETTAEEEIKRENYYCQERRFGAFSRSVTLPVPVVAEEAEATFENGVLTLTLPKAEEIKPKAIKVKAK